MLVIKQPVLRRFWFMAGPIDPDCRVRADSAARQSCQTAPAYRAARDYSYIWVALDEPLPNIPDLPEARQRRSSLAPGLAWGSSRALQAIDAACAKRGRDPATLRRSVAMAVVLPAAEQQRTTETWARYLFRRPPATGTVEQLADHLRTYNRHPGGTL